MTAYYGLKEGPMNGLFEYLSIPYRKLILSES